jgi:D-alanyl-D-alanine carboxypeptidase
MIKNTMTGRPWKSLVLAASLFMGVAANATPVLVVDADNHQVLHEEDAGVSCLDDQAHVRARGVRSHPRR